MRRSFSEKIELPRWVDDDRLRWTPDEPLESEFRARSSPRPRANLWSPTAKPRVQPLAERADPPPVRLPVEPPPPPPAPPKLQPQVEQRVEPSTELWVPSIIQPRVRPPAARAAPPHVQRPIAPPQPPVERRAEPSVGLRVPPTAMPPIPPPGEPVAPLQTQPANDPPARQQAPPPLQSQAERRAELSLQDWRQPQPVRRRKRGWCRRQNYLFSIPHLAERLGCCGWPPQPR